VGFLQDVSVGTPQAQVSTQGLLHALQNGNPAVTKNGKSMPGGAANGKMLLRGGTAAEIEAQMARESSLDSKGSSTLAPTPPAEPGQSWRDFKFDMNSIMRTLSAHLKDGVDGE
jgi:hypothetical protein